MGEKLSAEDSLRSSLQDVVSLVEKLLPICDSTEDLLEVCKLALENDAQLKLLIREADRKR